MDISRESFTPEKSIIEIRYKGKSVEYRLKHINKKGTFRKRKQCETCKFLGKVQIGLGFAFDISCDREEGLWKQRSGNTVRPCEHYLIKESSGMQE